MTIITSIKAFQIYDSRGFPTVACELILDNKYIGLSKIPSGASTGKYEACELRDNLPNEWFGKGVNKAISNINDIIAPKLVNSKISNQVELDKFLINLDGTPNKTNLGANAILAVSLAYCIASSKAAHKPLFSYIRNDILRDDDTNYYFPIPQVNVINGGKHSNNNLDFQEFMFMPISGRTWSETLKIADECFLSLQKILKEQKISIAKGDEGGFSVNLNTVEEAFQLLKQAVEKANYKLGEDVCFALDVAASEFYDGESYLVNINNVKTKFTTEDMVNWYVKLCNEYPIISIEDPFDQNDWKGFIKLNNQLLGKVQIVGDDLYCTNIKLLKNKIEEKPASAILIKLNQIGTLTECLETIKYAKQNNLETVISHRSGETEDDFIADLCLATNATQIKTGSMSRSERLAKYNRLIYIDQILVDNLKKKKDKK